MNKYLLSKLQLFFLFILFNSISIFSQNKIIPILPSSNNNLIYHEAEDALVTNFATTPTLNYSASGKKTLQLNTYQSNYNQTPFFSEYVIYVEEEGLYSFWYSGTPPGPIDDVYPSYSSPFTIKIDDIEEKKYREDINVVENYAPGFYWNRSGEYKLTKGYHNIRIEVSEKRKFDGKYYFYMDSFFLFKGDEKQVGETPEIFPKDLTNRSIDNSFRSISFYQNNIKQSPEILTNYFSLGNIYVLIGDYLSAIRMFSRVIQYEPGNKEALLLIAKSRIWNGEAERGISEYEKYLNLYPESLEIWEEAAKIAAWIGLYDKSIELYNRGLIVYPNNISLSINLALTYLWNSEIETGLKILSEQEKKSSQNINTINTLGDVYSVNGYPDYAINLYTNSIEKSPEYIELYLKLEKLFRDTGEVLNADNVIKTIKETFYISDDLQKVLDKNSKENSARKNYISELKNKINLDPMNLDLRENLVQTLFWNGLVNEAIIEYKSIITINLYSEIQNFDIKSHQLYLTYDQLKILNIKNNLDKQILNSKKNALYNGVIKYRTAIINNTNLEESKVELEKIIDSIKKVTKSIELTSNKLSRIREINLLLFQTEYEEENFFLKTIESKKWSFNDKYFIKELEEVNQLPENFTYTNYILHRYQLFNSNELLDIEDSSNLLLRHQNSLWNSGTIDEKNIMEISVTFPALWDEYQLINDFNNIEISKTEISPDFLDNVYVIINEIDNNNTLISRINSNLAKDLNEQKKILQKKLVRTIYKNEENTYLIRQKIGDYYLSKELYPEALEQYNLVISLDPYNTQARFNIGRLQQLTGKWKEALNSYESVFNVDTTFNNALVMHNNLSIQHPENNNGSLSYTLDPNLFYFNDSFFTELNISSWFKLIPQWIGHTYAFTKWNEVGAPSKYRIDDFLVNSQITINNNLIVKPTIGASLYNSLFDVSSPNDIINNEYLLNSNTLSPNVSIYLSNTIKNFTVTGQLSLKELPESSPDNIIDITTLAQEYSVTGYFPLKDYNKLKSFSFRTYSKLDNRFSNDKNNMLYTFVQDFILGLTLITDPWTSQIIYLSTSFETSEKQDTIVYYTPLNVFVSKIGGTTSTFIGAYNGVLGLSGRIGGGVYINKLGIDNDSSLTTDGDIEINYTKNFKTLFFKLYGSSSFSDSFTPEYWSIQGTLGFNIGMHKILSP